MNRRALGRTGLEVSELGLGGLFVSSHGAAFDEGCGAIRRALDLGVNLVDTAPTYADSEDVMGRALEGEERPLIISTKLGGRPTPFDPKDKDALRRSFETSLALLKRRTIDLLFVHEPDRPGQYDWWDDGPDLDGPVLRLLDELKRDGLVRFTGLAGTTAYELPRLMESRRFDVVLTAFNYSLLWREAAIEILPLARKLRMGVIAGSPLQQGALASRRDEEVESGAQWLSPPRRNQLRRLYRLLDETGLALPDMALRFVIGRPEIACVLTGARSAAEVERNVAAVERGPLPADILAELDGIASEVPFRPYEEPFTFPFGSNGRNRPGRA